MIEALPRGRTTDVIGRQLLRCALSVGANYRAPCRARSAKELAAKMGTVEEEADESLYWMEILVESGLMKESLIADLMAEADETVAMTVASIKSTRNQVEGSAH